MDHVRVIRTVRFRASHHYRRRDWSEAENRRVFGDQADPHEHDWTVEVHVEGPIDPATGWDGGDLNALVSVVTDEGMMPSTEVLARYLHDALSRRMAGSPARVARVRVAESPDLASEYPA